MGIGFSNTKKYCYWYCNTF